MKITSTLAKSEDGSVQINFNIPFSFVQKAKGEALFEFAKEIEVAGFRKGKAPISKVEEKISPEKLTEKLLAKILPKALSEALSEYKIRPAIYPKFELIKAKENEDWQLRARTCEIPDFELGDYKKGISGLGKAKAIWTPGKGDEKTVKEPTKEAKEQEIIKLLLETIHIRLPKVLIDEEVNARLSNLLARIEKLGLNLESYLASIGKTPEILRKEYETQAESAIAIELILEKVAQDQGIKIEEKQIDETIKAASADPKLSEKLNTPEQRRNVAALLRRRASLDSLISLL